VTLVYVDEFSLYRQPTLAPVYAPVGEEPTHTLSHRANVCRRYIGSLDGLSGQVVWRSASTMRVPKITQFLSALRQAYPERELYVAWDNWKVHTHADTVAAAERLGITLLSLPTYAPWTNPIEKLWRKTRQDVVHGHRLADEWAQLQSAVETFLDQFDQGSTELVRYVGLLPA
jgi:hypothetical protein